MSAQAWERFATSLARDLGSLGEDDFGVIQAGDDYYVQFMQTPDALDLEAVGDDFLPPHLHLSAEARGWLAAHGWSSPAGEYENWRASVDCPVGADGYRAAAERLAVTLRELYGVADPRSLTCTTGAGAENEPVTLTSVQHQGDGEHDVRMRELAAAEEKRRELERRMVETAVNDLLAQQFPGGRLVTVAAVPGRRGSGGHRDWIVYLPAARPAVVVVAGTLGPTGLGTRPVDDGSGRRPFPRAEQGSPQYLGHLLRHHPEVRALAAAEPPLNLIVTDFLGGHGADHLRYVRIDVDPPTGRATLSDFKLA